ncbi:GNAT family N-acetyltransferase [Erwinia endophytica]|uniref:GNAT family N-acetyltransferase n=1 Tax=Erwinia endophytica TaxID=1563158 RepID=UPI001F044E4F|nr:GNAT family N-acetyltransferase [Erwinia endophytica]
MSVQIFTMNEQHLDWAVSLTQHLQWPHRRADWQQALSLGEGLVAELDGHPVGTTLYWRWGEAYASVGLVIVADEAQGKGVGRQLMQAALTKLAGCNVRLHATEMGKGLYEKLGFVAIGQIEQHQSRALTPVAAIAPSTGETLRPACRADRDTLIALDRQAHGQYRPALIDNLFDSAERFLLLEKQGQITGFACQRRFGHGWVIGPIIAAELSQAKVLASALLCGLSGQFVRIDSDSHTGLGDWLNTLGMHEVDAPTTMMRGVPWQPDGMLAFGLMTQAMA